jgi:subtilase family serine protease
MSQKVRAPRRAFVLLVLAAVAVAVLAATTGHRTALQHAVTPGVIAGGPQYQAVGLPDTSGTVVRFGCQTRLPSAFPASSCYGPQQIWKAYGFDKVFAAGYNGTGRSITIIDAFGDPNIQNSVDTFASVFGIPSTKVNVVFPDGQPSATDPSNAFGWQIETDLDVEWAHAIAPGAKINLVVAKSNDDSDILSATRYVDKKKLGDVISQSFGENEACVDPTLLSSQTALFAHMTNVNHQTLLASAGDDGAGQLSCDGTHLVLATSSPAVDPNVTAVGGTALVAQPGTASPNVDNGDYIGESVWNEYSMFGDRTSTGGGGSTLFARPSYQSVINGNVKNDGMRWIPDVAYNAAIQGGVIVAAHCPAFVCGADVNTFFRVGGTSAGSPQWAGLVALAAQEAGHSLGAINPTLYALGSSQNAGAYYHDVVNGENTVPADFTGTHFQIIGYPANANWDASTGWGSPKADAIVPALAGS